ncbi:MAG: DUF6758 family protein [Marmoricola sp.]
MPLINECPCCSTPTAEGVCSRHPGAAILKRGGGYDAFAEVVGLSGEVPIYAPELPDFVISTTGCAMAGRCVATVLTLTGADALDGDYEVTIVVEEPLVGLGARVAGLAHSDPGEAFANTPAMHVRIEGHHVPLWEVDVPADEPLSRATFVGEWGGRWLWLVARPATAVMLVSALRDVGDLGPLAVELEFGGSPGW